MEDIQKFITEHIHDNPTDLHLKFHGKNLSFDLTEAITQIECRQKTRSKLSWFNSNPEFLYPSVQAAEQASNQYLALYHAAMIGCGRTVVDITAGLGIDAFTAALRHNDITALEMDPARYECLEHNRKVLGLSNTKCIYGDSIKWLQEHPDISFDFLFVDPARRDASNNRCFRLVDSLPNVQEYMTLLTSAARTVLIKASPLMDISQILNELDNVMEIRIVSYRGECKETLIVCSRNKIPRDATSVSVVDLDSEQCAFPDKDPDITYAFECKAGDLGKEAPRYAAKERIDDYAYIYELGAGMRKLDNAGIICRRFPELSSMSKNSGLFISDRLIKDFPGRTALIKSFPARNELKRLKGHPFRIVSHNYPVKAEDLRKKYGLAEGNEETIYATTFQNGQPVLICASHNF